MMKSRRVTLAQPDHSPVSTTSRIMRYPEFHYHWEYTLEADPETLPGDQVEGRQEVAQAVVLHEHRRTEDELAT